MGDTDDADIAGIRYSHADNDMTFRANNDVRMTIDSSGALLVHTSSRSGTGFVVEADTSLKIQCRSLTRGQYIYRLSHYHVS